MSEFPRTDDTVLVVDEQRAWTSAQVWRLADRLAHLIREATEEGNRRVAVYAENSAEAVIAHLGALRSGASAVAVNAKLSASEAAYQLDTGDVSLVISGPETADRARKAAASAANCRAISWGDPDWGSWIESAPDGPPADDRPVPPNLLFTSGTTGVPKATELPPNVFPRNRSWAEFLEATEANRFVGLGRHLVVAPLHHTGPLNAVRALAVGTPIGVLARFDPRRTLEAIEVWQIASTTLVPTHMSRLLDLPREVRGSADVSSMRLVFQTGSACPIAVKRAMIEWWGPVFLEAYGATEVGVTASITSHDWLLHPGSVGKAVRPYEAVVVDEDGIELPLGTEGRLCFRDSTGRGLVYHGDPERTEAAYLAPGLFTLGEIGRMDAEGWITITDRFSDMIVTGGVNVYPAEMEQVLGDHPEVADVAGVGAPHPDLGEILIALVVPSDPSSPPDGDDLRAWCESRLSRYKCPRGFLVVGDLERNALGKLDKRGLAKRFVSDLSPARDGEIGLRSGREAQR